MQEWLYPIGVVLLGYTVLGLTGFGSALVVVPLLAWKWPLPAVVALTLLMDVPASAFHSGLNWRQVQWRELRRRAVFTKYMVIYRTLADPAYLDLSIDPDERPMGSLFAFPDPFDANYGRGGLGRSMTARGWLSTWSGLSSHAKLADTMPKVKVPTLLIHPTADTEIRIWQAKEIVDNSGAADKTYIEMKGAPHYLEGHRREALAHVADWLGRRFP